MIPVVYAVVIARRIPQNSSLFHNARQPTRHPATKGASVLDLTMLLGHKLSSTSKGVPDVLDGVTRCTTSRNAGSTC